MPTVHTASAKGVQEVEKRIETLEAQRELVRFAGNSTARVDQGLEKARLDLERARKPDLEFDAQTREQVREFLHDGGPMPAGLPADKHELLETFSRLSSRGVSFTTAGRTEPLPPEEAFLALAAREYHAAEEQVLIPTVRGPYHQTVTVRPQYLAGVEFFLDKSLEGEVFYLKHSGKRPTFDSEQPNADGYVKVSHLSDFVFNYGSNPESALVYSSGQYLPYAERVKQHQEMEQFIADATAALDQAAVEDMGDHILVGGVALDKQSSDW